MNANIIYIYADLITLKKNYIFFYSWKYIITKKEKEST